MIDLILVVKCCKCINISKVVSLKPCMEAHMDLIIKIFLYKKFLVFIRWYNTFFIFSISQGKLNSPQIEGEQKKT